MINIIFFLFASLALWTCGALLSKVPNSNDIKESLKSLSKNFECLLMDLLNLFLLLIQDLFITDKKLLESNQKSNKFLLNNDNLSLDMITEREYASQTEDFYKNF
tara:strand:+ start:6321 stop:6635 length:315 start_codon:yes stop_codon:yes gene_type:complete